MASDLTVTPRAKHTMQRLEEVKRVSPGGDDYWSARQMAPILGYPDWDNFLAVINRAEEAIRVGGGEPSHHIVQTTKMMGVGKGAQRRGKEFFLSRGACYLIAINGDPSKPEIAGAQQYFTVQTRAAELAANEQDDQHRLRSRDRATNAFKRVSTVAKDAGVERFDYFHGARHRGLYDASLKDVEKRKGLRPGEKLLDRAGSLELAAHSLQMELAATKIVNENINGERRAIDANLEVGKAVRKTVLDQSGAKLEDLPLEVEHIGSVRKRLSGKARLIGKE